MDCQICNSLLKYVFSVPLYSKNGDIPAKVLKCNGCGSYQRLLERDVDLMEEHFSISSFTNLKNEQRYYQGRIGYFGYLFRLANKHLAENRKEKKLKTLDIGCSFGHLMQLFSENGCESEGIEPFAPLREKLISEGKTVFDSLSSVRGTYDIITSIDSLYYSKDPVGDLRVINSMLKEDGVLVVRVTNRTPYLNIMKYIYKKGITKRRFGDQLFAFSHKSMMEALRKANFRIETVYTKEEGKVLSKKLTYLYRVTYALTKITGIKLTAGLIYVCSKVK